MNIYSVHSHKGGVGKTTFSLFLSKYLAQVKRQKTCLIDLDFQAQGLRSAYLRKNLKFDFSDFLLAEDKKKEEITQQIAIKHEDIEHLYFIANLFKPHEDIQTQLDILKKIYIKLVNEIYTGEIMDNLKELLKHLERKGFKNIVIDDHPSLVLLSEEIIKEIKTTPLFITTLNIVSFVGLFKNILERSDTWKINVSELKIIINRAPVNFSLSGLTKALDTFVDSKEITPGEKLVCSLIKKQFLHGENGLMFIAENEAIRLMDTIITPRTLLSMDIPTDLVNVVEEILR
jgi:CO dehydrogenase nickel-insertion accessory protein CooC1